MSAPEALKKVKQGDVGERRESERKTKSVVRSETLYSPSMSRLAISQILPLSDSWHQTLFTHAQQRRQLVFRSSDMNSLCVITHIFHNSHTGPPQHELSSNPDLSRTLS